MSQRKFLGVVLACVLVSCFLVVGPTYGLDCPPRADQVTMDVEPSVRFFPDTSNFMYRYSVTNRQESPLRVDIVGVDFVPTVSNLAEPPGDEWWDDRKENEDVITWVAFGDTDPTPAAWNPDAPGPLIPRTGDIEPGETTSGFGFETHHPPGFSTFYALGMVQPPTVSSEAQAERISRECPGRTVGPFLTRAKRIPSTGPGRGLKVEIDIKPGSDPNGFNPNAEGNVPVALLGSDTFSVDKASDTKALFGVTMTEPVRPGDIQDVNNDGHDDLLFHFPMAETGITEENDRAALAVALTEPIRRCGQGPVIESTMRSGAASRQWRAGTLENLRELRTEDGPARMRPVNAGIPRREPCTVAWGTDTLKVVGPGSGGGQGPPGGNQGKGGPK